MQAISSSLDRRVISAVSTSESPPVAPTSTPINQAIIEIAKVIQRDAINQDRKIFLSIKKQAPSLDNNELPYAVSCTEDKLHLFADPKSQIVRAYISSRKADDKNPQNCVSGGSKMCTNAQRYEINASDLTISAPVEVVRLRIRPKHSAEKCKSVADKILRECEFYEELTSIPQICKMFDYAIYDGNRKGNKITKAVQYLEKYTHNLLEYNDFLPADQPFLRKHLLFLIFLEMLTGLEALHAKQIVHSDVKAGNIMVKDGKCVLIDFEYMQRVGKIDTRFAGGSRAFYAPEINIQTKNRVNEKEWTSPSSDIWAAGLVFWQLVNKEDHPLAILQLELLNLKIILEDIVWVMEGFENTFTKAKTNSSGASFAAIPFTNLLEESVSDYVKYLKDREMILRDLNPEITASLLVELNEDDDDENDWWEDKRSDVLTVQHANSHLIAPKNALLLDRIMSIPVNVLQFETNQAAIKGWLNRIYTSVKSNRETLIALMDKTYTSMKDIPAYDDPFNEMIRRMLDPNPRTRFTASEAITALEAIIKPPQNKIKA